MSSTVQQKSRRPGIEIVEHIADLKGVATDELSPLYDTIDSDALDALFQTGAGTDGDDAYVQFQYEGYTVVVYRDGRVTVTDHDA